MFTQSTPYGMSLIRQTRGVRLIACFALTGSLAGCGGSASNELAIEAPADLRLSQCEVEIGTAGRTQVVGTVVDPITIDGVETQACQLSTDVGQVTFSKEDTFRDLRLKVSHHYEPLVWVLDGTYEFGQSKQYSTMDELQRDSKTFNLFDGRLLVRPDTSIIVHRNANVSLTASASMRLLTADNQLASDVAGHWGGIIINGFGYHPDCPADSSATKLCNVLGPYGYMGGLAQGERQPKTDPTQEQGLLYNLNINGGTTIGGIDIGQGGLRGQITGAGKPLQVSVSGSSTEESKASGGTLSAAVTVYAPYISTQIPSVIVNSAGAGLELHGGDLSIFNLGVKNASTNAIHWTDDFRGAIAAKVMHNTSSPALLGTANGSTSSGQVTINNTTLVGTDVSGPTGALALSIGGGKATINNLLVSEFDACLQVNDSNSQVSISTALLNCTKSSKAAASGSDYASAVISAAKDTLLNLDPELDPYLSATNPELAFTGIENSLTIGSAVRVDGAFPIIREYPVCLGVGQQLDETVTLDNITYKLCQLNSAITSSIKLMNYFDTVDDLDNSGKPDYSADRIAWLIDGEVTVGHDFNGLTDAQRDGYLMSPITLTIPNSVTLLARNNTNAHLSIQPDVNLSLKGTAAKPAVIKALDSDLGSVTSAWQGITVHGWAVGCNNSSTPTASCALADNQSVDISYLRVFDAGANNHAALTLSGLNSNVVVDHVDLVGAGATGLLLEGGAANVRYLLASDVVGDQLAWQSGYVGTVQHAILRAGSKSTGHALHGRNDATNPDKTPRSRPVVANVTTIGEADSDSAILLEQGSGLLFYNSVVTGYKTCLDIDGDATNALQTSDPKGIVFDGVVLDCGASLALDDENAGLDFGDTSVKSSGVYVGEALLDSHFIATGTDIPAPASLNVDLIGAATYDLLDSGQYLGAVAEVDDEWYKNWTDSVAVDNSSECDGIGVFEGVFNPQYIKGMYSDDAGKFSLLKLCSLRGTITEDTTLHLYTGAARQALEDRLAAGDSFDQAVGLKDYANHPTALGLGYYYNDDGEVKTSDNMPIERTMWVIRGVVHVGTGNKKLTDIAQVEALKANPVHLTVEAGATLLGATSGSALHITRGGKLTMDGEAFYDNYKTPDGSTSPTSYPNRPANLKGMINAYSLSGTPRSFYNDSVDYGSSVVGGQSSVAMDLWRGIIVDGFGRHNQCPQADTAAANSQVCNIQGEFGYYGGYDNSYNNVSIHNLALTAAPLQLNAVGAGDISAINLASHNSEPLSATDQWQTSGLSLDGGAINLADIFISSHFLAPMQSMLVWNHGYSGNMQDVFMVGQGSMQQRQDGSYYPIAAGRNNAEDNAALPRSAPTIANMTIHMTSYDAINDVDNVIDPGISLLEGSSLYLYNSIITGPQYDATEYGSYVQYCLSADDSISEQLGAVVKTPGLFVGCIQLWQDNVSRGDEPIETRDAIVLMGPSPENGFNSRTLVDIAPTTVLSGRLGYFSLEYPRQSIVQKYSGANALPEPDFTTSPTADLGFLRPTQYAGFINYLTPANLADYLVDE